MCAERGGYFALWVTSSPLCNHRCCPRLTHTRRPPADCARIAAELSHHGLPKQNTETLYAARDFIAALIEY
jgi:hypothetical protein